MEREVKLQSLGKALKILAYFQVDRPTGGVTEISEYFGYTKSNVHDILRTLEAFGYVEQDEKTREYRLGYEIIRRGFVYNNTNDRMQRIYEIVSKTVNAVDERANIGILRGRKVLYLGQCMPRNKPLLLTDYENVVGYTAPLYCTGLGKALLAWQSEELIEAVIADGFERFTETTIQSAEELCEELAQIRQRGYATDNMEHDYGVRCVAVPVFNAAGEPVLSVSLRGMSVLFTDERMEYLAGVLRRCADEIRMKVNL